MMQQKAAQLQKLRKARSQTSQEVQTNLQRKSKEAKTKEERLLEFTKKVKDFVCQRIEPSLVLDSSQVCHVT